MKGTEKTRDELFRIGVDELGFKDKNEVIEVLRRNGIEGTFDPDRFDDYVAILSAHSSLLKRLFEKVNTDRAISYELDVCPICGEPVEHEPLRDGMFGYPWGWRCTSGESHWADWRLQRLKQYFTRNRGDTPTVGASGGT